MMVFGIKLGGSKSTTKSSYTKSETPVVPDWIQGPVSNAFQRVQEIGDAGAESLVAGPDALQTLAKQNAANLGNPSTWDGAAAFTNMAATGGGPVATVTAESLLSNLGSYTSPYLDSVINTSLADFDVNAGRTRGQQTLDLAGAGAFGGSGAALTRSMTEGELARARSTLNAGLRNSGFTTAAGLSSQDAQRRQEANTFNAQALNSARESGFSRMLAAGGQLANIASGFDASNRGNIGVQSDIGTLFRGMDSDRRTAGRDLVGWQNQQYAGLPTSLFAGSLSTGNEKSKTTGLSIEGSYSNS